MTNELNILRQNRHNLHIGRTYVEYIDGITFLYAFENPEKHLIGLRGKHSKDEMVTFAHSKL
jgi:hypothetical protein